MLSDIGDDGVLEFTERNAIRPPKVDASQIRKKLTRGGARI